MILRDQALVIMTVTCAWCRARTAVKLKVIAYDGSSVIATWPVCNWHLEAEACPACNSAPTECECSREALRERLESLAVCVPAW